eukprot:CAMPEP_0118724758 /NCGR_PEP_ID=MMETSP0800-20121206/32768_1 /TAXON_ID=210618 ORGANISM="Striatella unipunctata, Strain CCMP2910" /NCGR_SAMPLE_ID=MMETSP0800 /ASSEMBLY_ACC=CAM_ASM_000638 /LENGTH=125 /DNA_ID=CAMNT_0006633393 /DNA_START=225 /DNA_END=602 /DNA_ORIENTATION=+
MTLSLLPPIYHSIVYTLSFVSLIVTDSLPKDASFDSLQGITTLFNNPNGVFVGWVHYLVFDLLVGRMIVMDAAINRDIPYWLHIVVVCPCLVLTLMAGPMGWMSYFILSHTILPPLVNSTKEKKE